MCLACLKTGLRPHTAYLPREAHQEEFKTQDGIRVSQTGPDVRKASTGRPEGEKFASGLGVLSPFSCPLFTYLNGVPSPILSTN